MTSVTQIPPLVTIFGGSGFIGRHLVQALARRGYRIRVAVRNPNVAHHLQPLGNVGQIQAIQANLRHRGSIDRAVQGADCVVNLVGILQESGKQRFDAIQAEGARAVAEAAQAVGARLVHLSAIGADPESESVYARSKAAGEAASLETVRYAVVFRSSIVFGPEDDFFNRFRQHGALFALPAADRWGPHPLPAGLCDRRRRGDLACRRRQGRGRPGL